MPSFLQIPLHLLLAIALGLAIGFVLGRWQQNRYQNRGELLVSQTLKLQFFGPGVHLMNHITLPLKDGTTQIDHVLLTSFGIFVIETKHYSGWIFAGAKQATWTQVLYRKKSKFQNPLFQNLRHLRAVQQQLPFIPAAAVQPLVVFTGDAEFKTEMPSGVYSLRGLVQHLKDLQQQRPRADLPGETSGRSPRLALVTLPSLSDEQLQRCVGALEIARLAISGRTDVEHVQGLERRFGSVE